jgi:signal transduction histidine kinase
VARLLHSSEMLFATMLAVLLGFFLLITFFFTRALMDPIRRFQAYTRRIAQGDFSLIRPARAYRDEFSELALAVNQMLAEFQTNQEKLIQAGKLTAMGTITSGIAHELNNPLNNVAITTEALMEDFKALSDEEKWRLLQDIYFETERAGEIVKSLLDFTRDERPDLVPVDLLEVIEATRRIAQNEMVLNDVRFELRAPPGLPPVRGAANQLRQVFLNLFLNAVQAMPGGGPLTVEVMAERGSDRLCVEVRDEGIGIPPEHMPHVFDPFFTTKEPGKGTGLGLSICYSIIQKHGGTIEATSERGRGTTFHVCLPLANGEKTGAAGPRLDRGPAEA